MAKGVRKSADPIEMIEGAEENQENANIICEEWRGEFEKGEFVKTRKIKEVKITEEEMQIMNERCNKLNPIKYFPK